MAGKPVRTDHAWVPTYQHDMSGKFPPVWVGSTCVVCGGQLFRPTFIAFNMPPCSRATVESYDA